VLTVSAVIPATDSPPTLERCLQALAAGVEVPDETIVVDGPRELTVTQARNDGARRARGDVVLFVDADVEVHPDAVTRIRTVLSHRPDVAAVFGSYDDAPADPATVSAFRNLLHHHVHQAGAGPAQTFWTGLGAVRRECFLTVGGFDEQRFTRPSVEDVDLGMRLVANGERLLLEPTIQGRHLKTWTLASMIRTDFSRRGVPWVAMMVRHRRAPSSLNLGWGHRLSALASVAALASILSRRPAAAAASAAVLVALNHRFYVLLSHRLGPAGAAAGVALHGLHHLVAVASVPAGLAVGLRDVVRGDSPANPPPAASGPRTSAEERL
jgi:hypothetical protein